jgi:hypothetical protein
VIVVVLPGPLRLLAGIHGDVSLAVDPPVTQGRLIDQLDQAYPMLVGTLRDRQTGRRRPFIRFFAEGQDLSHCPPDEPLPESVVNGRERFLVVGAIAGG